MVEIGRRMQGVMEWPHNTNNKIWPFFIDYINMLNGLYILILVFKA